MKDPRFIVRTTVAVTAFGFAASAFAYDNVGYNERDNDQYDQASYTQAAPASGQAPGGLTYVTGGIGDEERMAMDDMRHNYNLRITNAARDGAFAGDTRLSIYDGRGQQLSSVDAGPLFYAEVPPGKYTIVAVNDENMEKKKTVRVSRNKASEVTLVW